MKRNSVIAAGVVLLLCPASVVALRFRTYDPAGSADSATLFDYCIIAGTVLLPVASVCFAKSLFSGLRLRFLLSWLVGFIITEILAVCSILWPALPPEGSYATKTEECIGVSILIALITGAMTCFDSLLEFLLNRSVNRWTRNGVVRFAVRVGMPAAIVTFMIFFA